MSRAALLAVRVGLPAAMVLVGIGLIVFGGDIEDGAGVFLIGAAVLVALLNAFMQLGNRSAGTSSATVTGPTSGAASPRPAGPTR